MLDTMLRRSSVRNYRTDRPIRADELEALRLAALSAPTSLDLQDQKFYFITDRTLLKRIEQGVIDKARAAGENDYLERLAQRENRVLFGAPLLILIVVNPANNYIDVDAGIAVQNLSLAAKSIGLDSVIMAAPDRVFKEPVDRTLREEVGIPDGYRFAISIAVGEAVESKEPHKLSRDSIRYIGPTARGG